jgi:hypothetical protein
MPTIDDEIRSRTMAFATDLAALVRQAALEAVGAALNGGATVAAPRPSVTGVTGVTAVIAKRGRGRPRKSAAPAPAPAARAAQAAPKAPGSRRRASGEKRPPGELARLTEKLGEYIKAHPGLRMEVIAKAIGAPPRELRLPATKLVAAKRIRAVGQKRGTEYFPV